MARRVSIITPCYNDGRYIMDAVGSVEKCDKTLYELIIVNDGSTDPYTKSVLRDLEDQGYQVIHQDNQGLGAARNTGISEASEDYILPLDADNKIRPEYLTLALDILESDPDVGVVYGQVAYFGEKTGAWAVPDFDVARLWSENFIDACAVYRKKVWEDVGGYDTRMTISGWEDWEFWLSAAEKNWKFKRLNKVVFDYRIRGDSMSATYRERFIPPEVTEYIAKKHAVFLKQCFDNLYAEYSHRRGPRNLVKRIAPILLRK